MIRVSAEVKGIRELQAKLQAMVAKAAGDRDAAVAVGFSAAYAMAVHENTTMAWKGLSRDPRVRRIEAGGDPAKARPRPRKVEPKGRYWDPQDRAKSHYLSDPAMELRNSGEFLRIMVEAMRGGKTLAQALLLCGLRLMRESQQQVPVDTGVLKASAFVRLEVGGMSGGNANAAEGG